MYSIYVQICMINWCMQCQDKDSLLRRDHRAINYLEILTISVDIPIASKLLFFKTEPRNEKENAAPGN